VVDLVATNRNQTIVAIVFSVMAGTLLAILIVMLPTYPTNPTQSEPTSSASHHPGAGRLHHERLAPTSGDLPGWPN
jgi:hypothetical protein